MNDKKIQNAAAVNTELYRTGFMPFLAELSDVGFRNVKTKFVEKRYTIADLRKNRLACEMLRVLCAPDILMTFDKERFAGVLNCFFPAMSFWTRHILDYISELIASIDVPKLIEHGGEDAKKAFKYLQEMDRRCKKCIMDINLADAIQYLVDIYKTVTCLEKIDENNEYRFQVDRLALEETDSSLQMRYEKLLRDELSFSMVGSRVSSDTPTQSRSMPKKYVNPLSWILIELICDQDGIVEETEEHDYE